MAKNMRSPSTLSLLTLGVYYFVSVYFPITSKTNTSNSIIRDHGLAIKGLRFINIIIY